MATLNSNNFHVSSALLAFGLAGGSAFMFVKLLVGELTPLQLVTGRVAMASLPLLVMMVITGSDPRISARFLASVTLLAVTDTIAPYLLIAWSQLHVSSSMAALLISTMPLFTTLIASRTAKDETSTSTAIAGMVIGFLGIAVLTGPEALNVTNTSALGAFAVITAAACYAAGAVYSKSLMRSADPIGLSAIKLASATLILVPLTAYLDGVQGYATLSSEGWLGLTAVGLVSTGVGRCVYQWVIGVAGSVRASLVTYIIPVVALFLGWAVLDEPIGLRTIVGASLIISGVASAMYGPQLTSRPRVKGFLRGTAPRLAAFKAVSKKPSRELTAAVK
ncbi:MAG TPA: DMT family transporter [Dehalococcoidia bacterium]|nr:DMT family transporter [Dehalococcoidia bacterium]